MGMIKCPRCGLIVTDRYGECFGCGLRLPKPRPKVEHVREQEEAFYLPVQEHPNDVYEEPETTDLPPIEPQYVPAQQFNSPQTYEQAQYEITSTPAYGSAELKNINITKEQSLSTGQIVALILTSLMYLLMYIFLFTSLSGGDKDSNDNKVTKKASTKKTNVTDNSSSKEQDTVVDNRKSSEKDNRNNNNNNTDSVNDSDFERTEYIYDNSLGDTVYLLALKNNSSSVVSVFGNATAYDFGGGAIGAGEGSIEVLGSGETSLMTVYFDGVTAPEKVSCDLTYKTDVFYKPVISNIKMEQSINDKNLTLIATNEGDYSAEFVEAYAIFLDGNNKVVSYTSDYITDGDSELKPGQSLSAQLDCYESFDHVECYLTGRASNNGGSKANSSNDSGGGSDEIDNRSAIDESKFENQGYLYCSEYGSQYFSVVKNNSDSAVSVFGNATAYDASGNVLGAGDGQIDDIGPGETSIIHPNFLKYIRS